LISIKTADFSYDLPPELIAQTPLDKRDASRLLLLNRETGKTEHRVFHDLPQFLRPGDCLVLNDSRVLPARLIGRRAQTGGVCELLLLRDMGDRVWECLARPGRKLRPGAEVIFGSGELRGVVERVSEGGKRLVRFFYDGIFLEILARLGKMPLPPYIKTELADGERYQTVYARASGSAAAPTAGLHFTPELLEKIRARGVALAYITLHVGLGTFRPVKTENIEEHQMHAEFCVIPETAAETVNRARQNGGRVIAAGTTSCRTLESRADRDGTIAPYSGFTDCFIYPGYQFKCVDGLITNFHLPESTLIMLVSALAGRENILRAYAEAIRERYRFFSFGDASVIL
jgi:S-adenosylmethionine:tRNA ribosyltransferase-isomerase